MTGEQLQLLALDPPLQLRPARDRSIPALWIRRLVVVRALDMADDNVIRDIKLRRGLNIVWTPPHSQTSSNALFKSGIAEHAGGKTMFCRMLRHALGERSFATEKTRKRIREKFSNGWVLAEVEVAGRDWAIARPFAVGAHPFCAQCSTVEELVSTVARKDYDLFLKAIGDATVSQLPAGAFPTTNETVRWEHLLPWLTRDQECRFADFIEWRHSSSQAEMPSLAVEERQFLVRSVAGLISDEEREEQLRNSRLVAERKEAARLAPILAYQAEADRARIEKLLGVRVAPVASELFGSEARSELERQSAEVETRLSTVLASDPRTQLRSALDHAIEMETNARRDVSDAEGRLQMEEGALSVLSGAKADTATSLLSVLPPPRDYCNVPMTMARERGCPIAISRPSEIAARRSERAAEAELEDQRRLIAALQQSVEVVRGKLAAAKSVTAEARRAYIEAATDFERKREQLIAERARLAEVSRLVREAEETWTRSIEQSEAVEELSAQIEASYANQEEIRRAGRVALSDFSLTFDYVVRALLGNEVAAQVDAAGRSLALVINHLGERESAALETVKLLAFDLAALTESIQGRGHFPRFLLHDGPREADMAADIYERLFLFVQRLEECFDGEPGFQYIVTTTTPPPAQFLEDPWCRLKLSGLPAEERLLKCDFQ